MGNDPTKPHFDQTDKHRKEDYNAYEERDTEDGWPYSDAPGTETDRLKGNRPYNSEDLAPNGEPEDEIGMHVESVKTPPRRKEE